MRPEYTLILVFSYLIVIALYIHVRITFIRASLYKRNTTKNKRRHNKLINFDNAHVDAYDFLPSILHPAQFAANTLHNFDCIHVPESSLSKRTGYSWWAVGGVAGEGLYIQYPQKVYVYKSRDGIQWEIANGGRALFEPRSVKYVGYYHSYYDGGHNIVYLEQFDTFRIFSRANIGTSQRSIQWVDTKDMMHATEQMPIRTTWIPQDESWYTISIFRLPTYKNILFALAKSWIGGDDKCIHLIHSYDYGETWRRTDHGTCILTPPPLSTDKYHFFMYGAFLQNTFTTIIAEHRYDILRIDYQTPSTSHISSLYSKNGSFITHPIDWSDCTLVINWRGDQCTYGVKDNFYTCDGSTHLGTGPHSLHVVLEDAEVFEMTCIGENVSYYNKTTYVHTEQGYYKRNIERWPEQTQGSYAYWHNNAKRTIHMLDTHFIHREKNIEKRFIHSPRTKKVLRQSKQFFNYGKLVHTPTEPMKMSLFINAISIDRQTFVRNWDDMWIRHVPDIWVVNRMQKRQHVIRLYTNDLETFYIRNETQNITVCPSWESYVYKDNGKLKCPLHVRNMYV